MAKRPSKIDRLGPDVRDMVGRLRDQGRTLDEIMAKLRELDIDEAALPSRTALHNHIQQAEAVAERLRMSRTAAEVAVRRLGEAEPDKVTRLNIDLMHQAVFEMMSNLGPDGRPVTLDPMQVMLLSKSLDHLGKASKDDVARTVAIEKRAAEKARAEALKHAEAVIEKTGATKGLSAEAKDAFKRELFGVRDG